MRFSIQCNGITYFLYSIDPNGSSYCYGCGAETCIIIKVLQAFGSRRYSDFCCEQCGYLTIFLMCLEFDLTQVIGNLP